MAKAKRTKADDLDEFMEQEEKKGTKSKSAPKGRTPEGRAPEKKEEEGKGKWYKTGNEAVQAMANREAAYEDEKKRYASVFHLKVGEEGNVIILDDNPFLIWQHTVPVGAKFKTVTCTRDFKPCPLCATNQKPTYVAYYTVLDLRVFTNKKGETTKFRKALFPAKGSVAKRIFDEKTKKKSLVGYLVNLKRYEKKAPNTGDIIELPKKYALDALATKFGKDNVKKFDYEVILAPPTSAELADLGFGEQVVVGSTQDLNDLENEM